MTADLATDNNGLIMMAYNKRETPWHRLGQAIPGDVCDVDTMLAAANADFNVLLTPVIACNPDGTPMTHDDGSYVYISNSQATVADWETEIGMNPDGSVAYGHTYRGLSTVGTRYCGTRNRILLERAMQVVNAADGAAAVDTVVVLDEGRQFAATINLGLLNLSLPDGVRDTIQPYLSVVGSHDGTRPNTFVTGATRIVCANTVRMALAAAVTTFKARHTENGMGFSDEDARKVLNLGTAYRDAFAQRAVQLASVPATIATLDKLNAALWPMGDEPSKTVQKNNDERMDTLRTLWRSDTNAGRFGANGWTVVQTVGEYLDHHRLDATKTTEMALTTINPDSWVSKKKDEAARLVLSGKLN